MLTNIASGFTTPQPFPGSQLVKSKIASSVEKDGRRLGSGKVSTRPSPPGFFVCLSVFVFQPACSFVPSLRIESLEQAYHTWKM